MLRHARKLGVEVGIFCALHTYGRQLNQHPHIHVSITRGGLDVKHGVWRDLFFKKQQVEEIWRGAVIRLLRASYDRVNPAALPGLGHIRGSTPKPPKIPSDLLIDFLRRNRVAQTFVWFVLEPNFIRRQLL